VREQASRHLGLCLSIRGTLPFRIGWIEAGIVSQQYVFRALFDKFRNHCLKRLTSFFGHAFQHDPHLVQHGERFLCQSEDESVSAGAVSVNHCEGPMHYFAAIFQAVAFGGGGTKVLGEAAELSSAGSTLFREKILVVPNRCQESYEFQEALIVFIMRLLETARIIHSHSCFRALSIGFPGPAREPVISPANNGFRGMFFRSLWTLIAKKRRPLYLAAWAE
jgi:hypothetical protein